MAIRITIQSGPQAGRVFDFDDTHGTVTVGRHPACDIVFPADYTVISRHHLAFNRQLARYRLLMQSDNPVSIDGEEAFEGDELPAAALVALGGPGGPVLKVETIEHDGLPPTERYTSHEGAARLAAKANQRSRAARSRLWGLTIALLAVVVVLGWMRLDDRREMSRLMDNAYNAPPSSQGDEQLATRLREAQKSVYLVALKDGMGVSPFGTAFVVAPGLLATSAHVAEKFDSMAEGMTMVVRSSGAPVHDLPIVSVTLHPQYHPFEEAWGAYGPLAAGAGGENRPIIGAGGYDVALLRVAPEQVAALGAPLPIAADADLTSLEPGDPAGYVGFPMESSALGGVNLDDPEAQLQIGHLTALTDFFLVKSDLADRQLLQHSLPVQGGASGSPLLDRRGQLIGVVSGGNLVEINDQGTRVPTGSGVNFAQRADLVRELLSGEANDKAEDRAAYWEKRLKRYQNEVDVVLADWAGSHGETTIPTPLTQLDGRTSPNSRYDMPVFVMPFSAPKAGWYLFLATSRKRENIDMMLIEETAKGPKLVGVDNSPDYYPGVEYGAEKGNELQVVVPGPANTDVRLRVYWLPSSPR